MLFRSQLVSVIGLLSGPIEVVDNQFTLIDEFSIYTIIIPSHLTPSAKEELITLLSLIPTGHIVEVLGVVGFEMGQYVIYVTNVDDFYADDLLDEEVFVDVLLAHFNIDLATTISSTIVLPSNQDLLFGATISWSSNQPSILSNTGVVVLPTNTTVVRLTYTIVFEGIMIVDYVDITVLAASAYTGYYASITGLSGNTLKDELKRIVTSGMKTIGYSSTSQYFINVDRELNNPGKILLVYDRRIVSGVWDGASTWNKEHVWPQSKLGSASDSDMHNLRASTPSVNSSRGNLAFVDGSGSFKKVGSGWYPGDQDRGDIARIIFYMNTRWNLTISSGVIGSIEMFVKWHTLDPVDDFERNRNNEIFKVQNNRNPYIDHPELVGKIYGVYQLSTSNESVSIILLSNIDTPSHAYIDKLNQSIFLQIKTYTS